MDELEKANADIADMENIPELDLDSSGHAAAADEL